MKIQLFQHLKPPPPTSHNKSTNIAKLLTLWLEKLELSYPIKYS